MQCWSAVISDCTVIVARTATVNTIPSKIDRFHEPKARQLRDQGQGQGHDFLNSSCPPGRGQFSRTHPCCVVGSCHRCRTTGSRRDEGSGRCSGPAFWTFEKHITMVARSCHYHAQAIRQIRHLLSTELTSTLARSLILTRLVYCNSLLHSLHTSSIQTLQRVQNKATRIVLQAWRRGSTAAGLRGTAAVPRKPAAVLAPLAASSSQNQLQAGCDDLQAVLYSLTETETEMEIYIISLSKTEMETEFFLQNGN